MNHSSTLLSNEMLASIVDEVTTAMFGRASSTDPQATPLGDTGVWTASVDVGEPVQYVVALRCRHSLALDAAARMLGEPEGSEGSAREVLGELTSMVSGNVKSVIAGSAGAPLGSPTVSDLAGFGGPVIQEVHLLCGAEPFSVAVFRPKLAGP